MDLKDLKDEPCTALVRRPRHTVTRLPLNYGLEAHIIDLEPTMTEAGVEIYAISTRKPDAHLGAIDA